MVPSAPPGPDPSLPAPTGFALLLTCPRCFQHRLFPQTWPCGAVGISCPSAPESTGRAQPRSRTRPGSCSCLDALPSCFWSVPSFTGAQHLLLSSSAPDSSLGLSLRLQSHSSPLYIRNRRSLVSHLQNLSLSSLFPRDGHQPLVPLLS